MMTAMALALALSAAPVKFEGSLKEAIEHIAETGGLNVVVSGDLDQPVKVHFSDLKPDEALESLAKVYHLDVTHEGKLWVVREQPTHEAAAVAPVLAVPAVPSRTGLPVVPPVPPVPPVAPMPLGANATDPDAIREAAERARDEAEEARDRAQELREQAREVAEARREEAQARVDAAKAHMEEAKARAAINGDAVSTGPLVVKGGTSVESAIAYGGPVVIENGAVVSGDAVAFGGDVVLQDNARVGGDAVSFGGRVVKGEGSSVHGETVAFGSTMLGQAVAESMVKAKAADAKNTTVTDSDGAKKSGGFSVASFFASFAMLFGLGFLMLMFAPNRTRVLEAAIRQEPVKNGFAGILALLVSVPLTLLLIVTLVGIPVAVLMWIAVGLALPVGLAIIANAVGAVIPTGRLRRTQAMVLALGVFVFLVLTNLPVIGPITAVLSIFVALGAMVRTRFGAPSRGSPIMEPSFSPQVPA